MGDLKRKQLLAEGFEGFLTFSQLRSGGLIQVPSTPAPAHGFEDVPV